MWGKLTFSDLESADRSLADSFYPCALATLFQYWEGLTDRQMSEATGTRLDLKYAMHLPLRRPGMQPGVLCAFRRDTLASEPGRQALRSLVDALHAFGRPEKRSPDVQALITAVCVPSRLEIIVERMSMALEALAASDPAWLRRHIQPHWYTRYGRDSDPEWLLQGAGTTEEHIQAVGQDGQSLLRAIQASGRAGLAQLPEVRSLVREWRSQFRCNGSSLALRQPCSRSCRS